MHAAPTPGRVAAIDHGSVRIGVAVSDPERRIASPLVTYTRHGAATDAEFFRRLVADERIVRFVVGLPVHLDGRESDQSAAARAFGAWLGNVTGTPVDYFDERFTSVAADEHLAAGRLTRKRRRARRDMLAAQALLAAYLEANCQGCPNPGSLDE